ncbi:glycine zipper 2TM domain-containing protein [Sphingomonas hankookensis]|uniref:glycine zipper 2TM domain-containing protein n=1 Tax=Sphingomonas hankookensis TaxID=563996 RepID=UPI003D303D4E
MTRPQPGYGWYRYYDDAVLADRDGRVLDYRRGIDWDARDNGRYVRDDRAYDRYRSEADLPPPPPPPPPPVARRDDGVGGAVIGGVVGGVAGNVVAGRGNRLGGTVLGAGVGALAGTAIDRAEDRRAPPPPPPPPLPRSSGQPGYGADYPLPGDDVPVAPDDGYYGEPGYGEPAPGVVFGPMREQVQPIRPRARGGYVERHVGAPPVARSYTTTTTTEGPGGYVANGYYYPPRTVTTVTVENAPVVTTTTEEVVTYTTRRSAPRRVQRSKLLRR